MFSKFVRVPVPPRIRASLTTLWLFMTWCRVEGCRLRLLSKLNGRSAVRELRVKEREWRVNAYFEP